MTDNERRYAKWLLTIPAIWTVGAVLSLMEWI